MSKKATHVISTQPKADAPRADRIKGGPISVYGRQDLDRRKRAAREAGVSLTVRKLGRGER